MFNEEAGAENCIRQVSRTLDQIAERNLLIVVDDGSTDETAGLLEKMKGQYPRLQVVHHERNCGYGAALQTGAMHAEQLGFEYVLFMDSDLTNDPVYLPLFVEQMRRGADVIKASRYIEGGGVDDVPWWRVWISRAGNRLASWLYGIGVHDCTNGFRAVRTRVFCKMPLREKRFPIIMEELYHAKLLGCTFAEVPNRLKNRATGLRRTSFSYKPSTFARYLKYPLKTRFCG